MGHRVLVWLVSPFLPLGFPHYPVPPTPGRGGWKMGEGGQVELVRVEKAYGKV